MAGHSEAPGHQIDVPPGLGAQLAKPYAGLEDQGHDRVGLAWKRGEQACLFILGQGRKAVRGRLLLAPVQRPIVSSIFFASLFLLVESGSLQATSGPVYCFSSVGSLLLLHSLKSLPQAPHDFSCTFAVDTETYQRASSIDHSPTPGVAVAFNAHGGYPL